MKRKNLLVVLFSVIVLSIPGFFVIAQEATLIVDGREVTISNIVLPNAIQNVVYITDYKVDSENYYFVVTSSGNYKVKWDGSSYEEEEEYNGYYYDVIMLGDDETEEKYAVAYCPLDWYDEIIDEDDCEVLTDFIYGDDVRANIFEDGYGNDPDNYLIKIYDDDTGESGVIDINGNVVVAMSDDISIEDLNPSLHAALVFNYVTDRYELYVNNVVVDSLTEEEAGEYYGPSETEMVVLYSKNNKYYYGIVNSGDGEYTYIIDGTGTVIKTFTQEIEKSDDQVINGIVYMQKVNIKDVTYIQIAYKVDGDDYYTLLDTNLEYVFDEEDYVYVSEGFIWRIIVTVVGEEENVTAEVYDFDLNLIYSEEDCYDIYETAASNFQYTTSISEGKYLFRVISDTEKYILIDVGERESINLNGVVKDEDGNYLEDATIELHSRVLTTQTSEYGYFSILDAAVGEHTLVIKNSAGTILAELPITLESGTATGINDNVITFKEGVENITVYISLTENGAEITKVVDGAINPETGDNIGIYFIILILSLISLGYVYKKRYN